MTNPANRTELLADLRAIVGEGGVVSPAPVATQTDWTNTLSGSACAAVYPRTAQQTAAILRVCHRRRIAVCAQGGNTGMSGGATPAGAAQDGIVLCLQKMNRIRSVDAAARALTAEAGCVLQTAQQAAADAGLFFPLSLGAQGSCSIGGNLATNAGGLNVLRYGSARDLCLGLEAALPDGRLLCGLSALRKNNSGYDLRHLLIGSEGTLAIITAATLKLLPPPRIAATALCHPPSPAAALELLHALQNDSGGALTAFEMLPGNLLDIMARARPESRLPVASPAPPWTALIEAADTDGESFLQTLATAQARGLAGEVTVAANETQRAAFWRAREEAPLALATLGKWLRHDIALPIAQLPAFITEISARLAALADGLYIIGFGHFGDGNLHLSARPKNADPAQNPDLSAQVQQTIYDCVAARGGAFSAEHGIGRLKTDLMRRYKDPIALALMQDIKQALDPRNILNPGALFG